MATPELTLEAHDRYGLALAWTDDGSTLATGGFDGGLATWSIPAGEALHLSEGHDGSVNAGVHTMSGDLVTASTDASVGRSRLPDLRAIDRLEGHGGTVAAVAAHRTAL